MKFLKKLSIIFLLIFFETKCFKNKYENFLSGKFKDNNSPSLLNKIPERIFNSNNTSENYNSTYNLEFFPNEYYKMFSPRLFEAQTECKNNRCTMPNGICAINTCKCLYGYVNSLDKNKTKYCAYKLKSQLWAFLLEAFTLIGGNIYLENYSYALFKGSCIFLICLIFLLEMPCRICGLRDCMDYTCSPCICLKTGTFVVCIFSLFIWEAADLLKIMSYKFLDNNQMPLIYYF
jgi:hypothetical protein